MSTEEAQLRDAWCSWCFEKTSHLEVEWKLLHRNLYECKGCRNKTNCCVKCSDGMARNSGADGSSLLCASCDKTIAKWGEHPDLHVEGYCSWCFEKTSHTLQKYNYFQRSIYSCDKCSNRTLKCLKCTALRDKAFARGHLSGDEEFCFSCAGVLKNWEDVQANVAATTLERWCGWCIEKTKHKLLEHTLIAGRDTYSCLNCECTTAVCTMCEVALARGGTGLHDVYCSGCSQSSKLHEKLSLGLTANEDGKDQQTAAWWENLHRRKMEVYENEMKPDNITYQLTRDSAQRKLSIEAGMIRPFILLVAMPPEMRNRVACSLGWPLITEDYFGDPHLESWDIISRPDQGIIARANSVLQNINPLASNCTYYQVVNRVIENVYGKTEFLDMSFQESLPLSQSSANMQVPQLEEYIMTQLVKEQRKSMTKEQREAEDLAMKESDMQKMAELMRDKAGLQSQEATKYALGVVKSALRFPGRWGITMFTLQAIQTSIPASAIVVTPTIAGLSVILTPLALVGTITMILRGLDLMLGPSLGRLYFPIVMMINQRLLMAAQDMKVEKYY